jgi:YD repeat-containing protein
MSADTPDGDKMIVLPPPATVKTAADRFTGDVWVDGITNGARSGAARLATVHSAPGARTAWHCHAHGQTLRVTDGRGLVRSRDGQTVVMRAGDTVFTPPGVWHWHGALPSHFMTHLALSDSSADTEAADVEWGDHVKNDEYTAAATGVETERSAR